MSDDPADDPRCPECGEPVGARALYCMHCSADLSEESDPAAVDGSDGETITDTAHESVTDTADGPATDESATDRSGSDGPSPSAIESDTGDSATGEGEPLLDPDGFIDGTLTVAVGLAGGLVVGFVGTIVLVFLTDSGWALPLGMLVWLLSTAYLVRRPTVQAAVASAAYAVALVLVSVPLIAFAPGTEGGVAERFTAFVGLLLVTAIPAGIAAGVGFLASRFVPESSGEG